jgi:hypothetical protein
MAFQKIFLALCRELTQIVLSIIKFCFNFCCGVRGWEHVSGWVFFPLLAAEEGKKKEEGIYKLPDLLL